MTDHALNSSVDGAAPADPALRPNLDKGFNPAAVMPVGRPLGAAPADLF